PTATIDPPPTRVAPPPTTTRPPPTTRETPPPTTPRPETPPETTSTPPRTSAQVSAADLVRSAQSALLRGQVGDARDLFRDATRVSPRHAPAWRGLGIASEQLHEIPEARTAFERYLEINPDAPDAETIRGRLTRLGG
ncbi:MAG: tetratricopeptide repeat protein, partial [Deltaproteobacteria bacterium]|nr:tetratricopeptide repeat protein [Deltaproteobacteria bacterium]